MTGTRLLLACALITVAPILVYVCILWFVDRYEKEPASFVGAALLGGAGVAPLLVWLTERLLGISNSIAPASFQAYPFTAPALSGAIVEEIGKGVVVVGAYVLFRREFDGMLDGIAYGAAVGAGFALAEAVSFLAALVSFGGAATFGPGFFFGVFLSGLTQCVFSGIFGASLGYVREASSRGAARTLIPIAGLVAAILYHVGYVAAGAAGQAAVGRVAGTLLLVVRRAGDWAGLVMLGVVIAWALSRERAILRWGLAEEVDSGVITRQELTELQAGRRLAASGALRAALGELAFAKWRAARGTGTEEDIRRWRERVLALRGGKEGLR